MTILFPFTGDTVGGSHAATISLIKKLNAKGILTKIILHQHGPLVKRLQDEGLEFEFINYNPVIAGPFFKQATRMLKAVKVLSAWMKERDIRTVHTNDLRMHYTWAVACRLSGTRHIWHQHSHAPSLRLWLYMVMPHHILTISEYTASALPQIYKRKITVIYNDFDLPGLHDKKACHECICVEMGIDKRKKIVGFVGNFTKQKRPDFFLDLAKAYFNIPSAPPAHFVLLGSPRDETSSILKRKLNDHQLQDCTSFMGPRFPIEPYIAGFDALIAPALCEGLGRTLIEAMLLKTPVFAADHGGHKEIIQDEETGFLFNPESPEQCAQKISEFLQRPETSAIMNEKAQEQAIRKFTGPTYLQKIIDIYKDD